MMMTTENPDTHPVEGPPVAETPQESSAELMATHERAVEVVKALKAKYRQSLECLAALEVWVDLLQQGISHKQVASLTYDPERLPRAWRQTYKRALSDPHVRVVDGVAHLQIVNIAILTNGETRVLDPPIRTAEARLQAGILG
jgi:hypothetical protein